MSAANALLRPIALAVCAVTLPCGAEEVVSGRSKAAQIPDDELNVIVDLTQENGTWIGSIVIPGLDVKDAPLTEIAVKPPDVSFTVKARLLFNWNCGSTQTTN